MKKILLIFLLILNSKFLILNSTHAASLSSPSFRLEIGDVNVSQINSSLRQDQRPKTKDQRPTAQVLSGKVEPSLAFALSPSSPLFPKPSAGKPETQDISLWVKPGENQGFLLTIAQDNLQNQEGKDEFPQFAGDSGDCEALKNPCSWVASSTFGLGFRLETPKSEEYKEKTSFKKIPAVKSGEPQGIILAKEKEGETSGTLKLKINLPKRVMEKSYQTTITYTVLPTY